MGKVGQHIWQVASDQLGGVDHRRQAAVRRPEVPALPELGGPGHRGIAPQFPQRLLQRPRPAGLEFSALELIKARFGLVSHVRRVGQPQVFTLGQGVVASLHQSLVLLLPDLVHGIEDVPHDVEAVEDHLAVGAGHLVAAGIDVGRPHVQADRFDLLPALSRKRIEVGSKTRFLAVFTDVLDGRFFQVAHQSHVAMALGDRLLVDADLLRDSVVLGGTTTKHRTFHQVPAFVPSDAQDLRCLLDVRRQQDINGQRFEQIGEPAARLRPWQGHLMHAVLRTRYARRSRMQVGEELAAVEVAPDAFGEMVIDPQLASALGAGKALSVRVPDMNFNMLLRHIQFDLLHRPGRRQPKQLPVQLHAVHRTSSLQTVRKSGTTDP